MTRRLSDPFLRAQSDERLVQLTRDGQERAFAAIVERYGRELDRFARRLRSDGQAEDLVQQTFLSAFAALRSGAEVAHLRGWLYRILRNAAISASGRTALEAALDGATIAGEPLEDAVERRMLAHEVLSELAGLPVRQRDALLATAIQGRSRAAVARSMGLTEGAVRQLMHRARVTLRASITAITPWPLAKWVAATSAAPAADRAPDIVLGAGSASAGAVALKLGTIMASAVVATGIVSSQMSVHARRPLSAPRSAHTVASPRIGAATTAHRGVFAATPGGRVGRPSLAEPTLVHLETRGADRSHRHGPDGGADRRSPASERSVSFGGSAGRSDGGDAGGGGPGGSGGESGHSGGFDRGGSASPSSPGGGSASDGGTSGTSGGGTGYDGGTPTPAVSSDNGGVSADAAGPVSSDATSGGGSAGQSVLGS